MPAATPAPAAILLTTLNEFYKGSLPDGIYLALHEDDYHADSALGSSNIRDLLKGANLYWHKSRLNPNRKKDKKTPSKILGSATHKLLLEGKRSFEDLYIRGPYSSDDDHLSSAEKSALTKAAKKDLLEGQELLTADDYDFVTGCKSVIDTDPELKGCLDNAITELSIFWTRPDGVRCKARHDAFKLRGIGDIKTIANERERDLPEACRLDINTYRYDVPARHYLEGRRQMPALFAAGKIFYPFQGRMDRIPSIETKRGQWENERYSFLEKALAVKDYAFQLVFIPKKGAPDAWSCVLSPGNPILDEAGTDIELAIERFRRAMVDYGPKQRWLPMRPVRELYQEELPVSFGRNTRRID